MFEPHEQSEFTVQGVNASTIGLPDNVVVRSLQAVFELSVFALSAFSRSVVFPAQQGLVFTAAVGFETHFGHRDELAELTGVFEESGAAKGLTSCESAFASAEQLPVDLPLAAQQH